VTGPLIGALAELDLPYPPPDDPATLLEQEVRYTYWPVAYQFGDPTVISNVSLPLSGVQFSQAIRGVGEFRASLQLTEDEVRAIYPWDKIMPRKSGIVVVRSVFNNASSSWESEPVQHYVIWAAPRDPHTGRMSIYGTTVEGLWARRLITKAMSWSGQDQTLIAADLLDPNQFSQIPLGSGMWTGWINVDPPVLVTGVARTFSYAEGQETNLLEAHQNRSQLATNSYEWTTRPRVLVGDDAESASTFRLEYQMGFPYLGQGVGGIDPPKRMRFDTYGSGNVLSFSMNHDGSEVPNIMWARGKGYDQLQVKALVTNVDQLGQEEWEYGFLQTEAKFSDPDVSLVSTLTDYARKAMWEKLGSEQFIPSLTIRGDMPPYFGTYSLGDQFILETNDATWRTDLYGDSGYVEVLLRAFGWVVTPPQGEQSEHIQIVLGAGALS
jgi:hypothetical protein